MPKRLNVLPNPALKPEVTDCPLLEGNLEGWIVCCSRRFFPLARRIAGEDSLAEDALQASWIKILQSINHAYFDGPKACPWVAKIVANAARDEVRQRGRRKEVAFIEARSPVRTPEELAQERQLHALLHEMVRMLPNTYRQVIELRVYEGFSTRQTAERLHVSQSNARTRLHRAVTMIHRSLDARLNLPRQNVDPGAMPHLFSC